jgi:hypothetical protein
VITAREPVSALSTRRFHRKTVFDPDSVDSSLDVSIDNSDNLVRDRCDRVGAEEVGEGDMDECGEVSHAGGSQCR